MKLKKEDIKKLGSLSKIKLSEEEIDKFTKDMDTIISSVETLQEFDCKNSEILNEIPFEELRDDKVVESFSQEDALKNAPFKENGYFKVHGDIFDEQSS